MPARHEQSSQRACYDQTMDVLRHSALIGCSTLARTVDLVRFFARLGSLLPPL
jgi:hypothetical protein